MLPGHRVRPQASAGRAQGAWPCGAVTRACRGLEGEPARSSAGAWPQGLCCLAAVSEQASGVSGPASTLPKSLSSLHPKHTRSWISAHSHASSRPRFGSARVRPKPSPSRCSPRLTQQGLGEMCTCRKSTRPEMDARRGFHPARCGFWSRLLPRGHSPRPAPGMSSGQICAHLPPHACCREAGGAV